MLVAGLDFGTDSVRALIVSSEDGRICAAASEEYPRWSQGLYCEPAEHQFRQHPLDYLETMKIVLLRCRDILGDHIYRSITALGIDTTGSTPCFVTREGLPLSFLDSFANNPNAMSILWKDHSAIAEAEEITVAAKKSPLDYTCYSGGSYSPEWFWAKILYILRHDADIGRQAYSVAEHCDWLPALLCGTRDVHAMRCSRSAAGHKAMWHADFAGLPPEEFWTAVDPLLTQYRSRLYQKSYTSDQGAGQLSGYWAQELALPEGIVVAVGSLDAHAGAVGAGIQDYDLVRVMGTSTCDMLIAPRPSAKESEEIVAGICGQVDGSIVPGKTGFEAGQASFGDVIAWFRDLLLWNQSSSPESDLLTKLEGAAAQALPSSTLFLDWFNGRRSPHANPQLSGAIWNINLGSSPPRIYRSLLEGLACGSRAILECYLNEQIAVHRVIAVGGIAQKAPLLMQILADSLQRDVLVSASDQASALGSCIYASVAGAIHPTVEAAIDKMAGPIAKHYHRDASKKEYYDALFQRYTALGSYMENSII